MKMMVCIELDIDANTTARHEIRRAVKNELLKVARLENPGNWVREVVNEDKFIVRAPERKKEETL